ncbi:MAG: DNA-binding response regulator, partial [Hyphomicrobiales bacterium]|nr:DNA-binding response regulator [Hyphomicrobiales bacterium]
VAGDQNKEAARALGISPRTVEIHRANILRKTGARGLADLVRAAMGGEGRRP